MPQQETDMQTKRHRGNIAGLIINIVLIVAIIIAFFCTYTAYVTKNGSGVPDIFGYEPFSIQSDSMSPFFEKGDLVIDKRVEDTSKLEVGDIITFWTIIDGQKVLNTHRIIDIQDGDNFRYFVTKGDNNSVEDSLTVHESEIVGVYHKHIKKLGGVLDFLQTSKGFFCIIVLPVLAFFIYYFVSFFRVLMEYQGEKRRLLYEQELVASGRLTKAETEGPEPGKNGADSGQTAEDEKPMREVFNRFLEKHQGKPQMAAPQQKTAARQTEQKAASESKAAPADAPTAGTQETNPANVTPTATNPAPQATAPQTATQTMQGGQASDTQAQLAKQLEEMQRQMELLRQQNEAAQQAAAQAAQLQQMQMQMDAARQAQQQMQQNTSNEGITLSKEQLMALLGQANIQVPGGAQAGAQVAAQQQAKPQENADSISMSKSEFVDLMSLAMKKAKEEE